MRILFVSDSFPYPPDSGTKVRDYNLIRRLADRCSVSLLAFVFSAEEEAGMQTMQQWCERVTTVRYRRQGMRRHIPGTLKCLLHRQPLACTFMHSPEFAGKLKQLTVQQHFDVVQIDCTPMAPYRNYISSAMMGSGRTQTALVFIDVNAYKFKQLCDHDRGIGSRLRWWLDWQLMRGWEAPYAANFDACVMMSEVDAQRVRRQNPQLNTMVIPNGVDITEKQPLSERVGSADILLIGTLSHAPWKDAVHYFHDCIFPLIRDAVPQARMLVVGNAPGDVATLASEQVLVAGRVSEVLPFYEQACLSVVPLRSGGGTRLKILEALAYGRPVVSTSIGSEGLDLCPGRDLLIADEPDEFARQTIHLLTDPPQRRSLIQQGRRTVEMRYCWDTIADQLLASYEQLCGSDRRELA